jgi:Trk K+ transport system NAD-binding subunit
MIKEPVIIIGGGRVGRATVRALQKRGVEYRIIEQLPERIADDGKYILGSAADLEVLDKAGIMKSPTAIITTHDDDTNIYLVIYCRRLRPDIQIISRATLERNVATLHRAGADFVMSYASMGANTIFNLLDRSDILMVAEGLDVFKVKLPTSLAGKTLADSGIRQKTGCNVVAIVGEKKMQFNLDPHLPLPEKSDIILIGSVKAENRFLELYGNHL